MFTRRSSSREWAQLAFNQRTAAAIIYLVVFGSLAGFSARTRTR